MPLWLRNYLFKGLLISVAYISLWFIYLCAPRVIVIVVCERFCYLIVNAIYIYILFGFYNL